MRKASHWCTKAPFALVSRDLNARWSAAVAIETTIGCKTGSQHTSYPLIAVSSMYSFSDAEIVGCSLGVSYTKNNHRTYQSIPVIPKGKSVIKYAY